MDILIPTPRGQDGPGGLGPGPVVAPPHAEPVADLRLGLHLD